MKKGFNQGLSNLEAEIMDVIWSLGSANVRGVMNKLKRKPKLAYTTIMTVMSRLFNKGVLKRRLLRDAYIYTPVQDKPSFYAAISKKIINDLINNFGEDIAIAQFIDVIEGGNVNKIKEWRRKLKRIL